MAQNKKKKVQKTLIIGGDPVSKKRNVHQYAITDMRAGINSAFWQTICEVIKANVNFLGEQILAGTDEKGEPLNEMQLRQMRKWRNLNVELLTIPEKCIKDMEQGVANPVEFDPYYKVYSDILADKAAEQK